jgi:PII-like signaling protein
MRTSETMKRVMIFVSETDRYQHSNLAAALLEKLKKEGCGGATVFKGSAGFGANKQIHTNSIVDLAVNLPDVVMFIEMPEKVEQLLPVLQDMIQEGFISIDDVETIKISKK